MKRTSTKKNLGSISPLHSTRSLLHYSSKQLYSIHQQRTAASQGASSNQFNSIQCNSVREKVAISCLGRVVALSGCFVVKAHHIASLALSIVLVLWFRAPIPTWSCRITALPREDFLKVASTRSVCRCPSNRATEAEWTSSTCGSGGLRPVRCEREGPRSTR